MSKAWQRTKKFQAKRERKLYYSRQAKQSKNINKFKRKRFSKKVLFLKNGEKLVTGEKTEIEPKLSNLLGKKVKVTNNAEVCLQMLEQSEKNFYSWHLKLLSIIFELVPETFDALKQVYDYFERFDFEFLDLQVETYFEEKSSSPFVTHDTVSDFDDFLEQFFVKSPDTGAIAVLYSTNTSSKNPLIKDYVTVDHLIAMLFYTLYAGAYESDLAIAILLMSERGLYFHKTNRRYLDSMEGIITKTEAETQK